MALNVSPVFIMNDQFNSSATNAEVSRQLKLRDIAGVVPNANGSYLIVRKPRSPMLDAFWHLSSLLYIRISSILLMCAKPQMGRVYASWNVAGMTENHVGRNWRLWKMNPPRHSCRNISATLNPKGAISPYYARTSPYPAISQFGIDINIFKKAFSIFVSDCWLLKRLSHITGEL